MTLLAVGSPVGLYYKRAACIISPIKMYDVFLFKFCSVQCYYPTCLLSTVCGTSFNFIFPLCPQERTKSKGYIDLRQCVLIKDQPKYAGSGHEFPFVLSHESGRDYILAATQFNERADWMRFIQPLVKAVHEQDPMSPRSRDTKRVTAKSESKPRASDAAKPSEKQAPVPLATKAEMKAVEKVMDSFESEGPKLQHVRSICYLN